MISRGASEAGSNEPLAQELVVEARNPATGELLAQLGATAPELLERIVAEVAKVQPLWALLQLSDRARYMRRMAQAVIDDFDELTIVLAREQGRPAAEIAALELLGGDRRADVDRRGRRRGASCEARRGEPLDVARQARADRV